LLTGGEKRAKKKQGKLGRAFKRIKTEDCQGGGGGDETEQKRSKNGNSKLQTGKGYQRAGGVNQANQKTLQPKDKVPKMGTVEWWGVMIHKAQTPRVLGDRGRDTKPSITTHRSAGCGGKSPRDQ